MQVRMNQNGLLLVLAILFVQGGISSGTLRQIPGTLSWSDAKEACLSINGTLARLMSSDLETIKQCPDYKNGSSFWSAGYSYLTPWMQFQGCYLAPENTTSHNISDPDECYSICRSFPFIGLQVNRCYCLDDMLSTVSDQNCSQCSPSSLYSCGLNNHLAIYEPKENISMMNNFCLLDKNETCDCGVFQCEEAGWQYYARNCSYELPIACKDEQVSEQVWTFVKGMQECDNRGSYLSGPNIAKWCSETNVTLRRPYWGNIHRDRKTFYLDSKYVSQADITNIGECQYISTSENDITESWTKDCSSLLNYLCRIDSPAVNENDCGYIPTTQLPTTKSSTVMETQTTEMTLSSSSSSSSSSSTLSSTLDATTTHIQSTTIDTMEETTTRKKIVQITAASVEKGIPSNTRAGIYAGVFSGVLALFIILFLIYKSVNKNNRSNTEKTGYIIDDDNIISPHFSEKHSPMSTNNYEGYYENDMVDDESGNIFNQESSTYDNAENNNEFTPERNTFRPHPIDHQSPYSQQIKSTCNDATTRL